MNISATKAAILILMTAGLAIAFAARGPAMSAETVVFQAELGTALIAFEGEMDTEMDYGVDVAGLDQRCGAGAWSVVLEIAPDGAVLPDTIETDCL